MSKVLCTFPGKIGDILWAMPTMRAIAEDGGNPEAAPVDFICERNPGAVPEECHLEELMMAQPYIGKAWAETDWYSVGSEGQQQRRPACAVSDRDNVHLGYKGWPQAPLAEDIAQRARVEIDLSRPWILPPPDTSTWSFSAPNYAVVVGFSDEWAELKAGLVWALNNAGGLNPLVLVPPNGSRLHTEWLNGDHCYGKPLVDWYKCDLREAARIIANCSVFVGCLSSLAVLAAAMGKPRVLVEPSPARQNPIFQHPDCPLIKGNDGLPTVDARAMIAAVKEKLNA